MSKDYRNYVGLITGVDSNNYNERLKYKGISNIFDDGLDQGYAIAASGGTEFTPGDGYTYHVFTNPGNFTIIVGGSMDALVVAGGGGGGDFYGGGGGGGGVAVRLDTLVTAGVYPVEVGGGGAAGTPSGDGVPGGNGSDSTFDGITSLGGGGGASGPSALDPGSPGGSGGGTEGVAGGDGGTATQPTQPQPPGTFNYGNDGAGPGSGPPSFFCGGGGGAGGAGGSPSLRYGGPGLAISTLLPGTPGPVAATLNPTGNVASGGAGGAFANTAPTISCLTLPSGGGFAGRPVSPAPTGSNGEDGGGTGGGGESPSGYLGGIGGAGIVIIRYVQP